MGSPGVACFGVPEEEYCPLACGLLCLGSVGFSPAGTLLTSPGRRPLSYPLSARCCESPGHNTPQTYNILYLMRLEGRSLILSFAQNNCHLLRLEQSIQGADTPLRPCRPLIEHNFDHLPTSIQFHQAAHLKGISHQAEKSIFSQLRCGRA